MVRVCDDHGKPLDATFAVEGVGDDLTIVFKSRGGAAGSHAARNVDYNPGLEHVLRRLQALNARLADVVVDSRALRGSTRADRRVHLAGYPYPQLQAVGSIHELRKEMGRAQGVVGKGPSATKGNPTRRIRLFVELAGAWQARDLERHLAGLAVEPSEGPKHRPASEPRRADGTSPSQVRGHQARGQGFRGSAEAQQVVEAYAQTWAIRHFESLGYAVEVHGKPFDLLVTKGAETLYVECKGTTTPGETVFLTAGEVKHARKHRQAMVLFVVHSIDLRPGADGPVPSGGRPRIFSTWDVDSGELRATQYQYTLPKP